MLDIDDGLITLGEASKLFPRRRNGAKPHLSTLWRWCINGFRGTKLEHVRVGASLCTTRAAVKQFIASMSGIPIETCTPQVINARRQREIETAEKRLAARLG